MNTSIGKFARSLIVAVGVSAAVLLLASLVSHPASAQIAGAGTAGVSPRLTTFSSLSFSNTTSTNLGTNYVVKLFNPFNQGHRVAGTLTAVSTAATNQVPWTNTFDLSLDGTNWTTTGAFTNILPLTGTTNTRQPFVIDLPIVDGFQYLKWSGISGVSGTSYVTVTLQLGVTP
jgi:hypothetical protein